MKEKLFTTFEVYDDYERRFAKTRMEKPLRQPWKDADRAEILEQVKQVLSFREELIPQISQWEVMEETCCDGITVQHVRYQSWENFYGSGTFLAPCEGGKRPLIVICCGHGDEGRLTVDYQKMAATLAKQGAYVYVNDNIGQGERAWQGHKEAFAPFYCGLSLQGLIVMETVGLIRHLCKQDFVDTSRVGACGNSGGGTLTTFLAAVCPEIQALFSSGYPSEFTYVLQKEKRHCACNLLPHVAGKVEMWEVLSLFAPKPLYIEQGTNDSLLPVELFRRCARKVKLCYQQMDCEDRFFHIDIPTLHSWEEADMAIISDFFSKQFGLAQPEKISSALCDNETVHVTFPEGSYDVRGLCASISGNTIPEDVKLWEIYPLQFRGEKLDPQQICENIGRGPVQHILAQMEMTL